jgi:hypothetical protein
MSEEITGKTAEGIFGSEIPRSEVEMWMKRAREQTPETLPAFLKEVQTLIPESYGNAVHKLAIQAIAATWAADKATGGITGFMAGCVMWEYIQFWMSNTNPQKLLDFGNMLYPQYEDHFTTISKDTFRWLQEEARKRVQEQNMAPRVREHMEEIIMGKVPFGFRVGDDR